MDTFPSYWEFAAATAKKITSLYVFKPKDIFRHFICLLKELIFILFDLSTFNISSQ